MKEKINIAIKGNQSFNGLEIPVIEGGFGENQKVMLAKTIAEIHGVRTNDIQDLIQKNIDEFEPGIDLLDLCEENFKTDAVGLGLITSNRQKNCYLLSEQGYMLLVGFMKTEKAKEIRKQLRREYFSMREIIDSYEIQKGKYLSAIYEGGQDAIIASRELSKLEVKRATKPLIEKIEEDKPKVDTYNALAEPTVECVDVAEFSKILKKHHIDLGRNKLFRWLRDNKYLMTGNVPYQSYMNRGYFQVIETVEHNRIHLKTLITGKGQIALLKKLLQSA